MFSKKNWSRPPLYWTTGLPDYRTTGLPTTDYRLDSLRLPHAWLARRTAVTGVCHIRGNSDLILLHDDTTLAVIDKDKDLPEPSAKVVQN